MTYSFFSKKNVKCFLNDETDKNDENSGNSAISDWWISLSFWSIRVNLIYITLNRLRKDHVIKKALQLLWHLPFFPIVGLPCPSYQLRKCSEKGAIRILEIFRLNKKTKAITWPFRPQVYWKCLPWDIDRVLRFQPSAQLIIQMGLQWSTVKYC